MSMLVQILLLTYIGICRSDYTDPHCDGKQAIVHLFEWKWSDIAAECERFLSKKGFCGVQISPANEHLVKSSSPPYPWWQRYQPVSYKINSRSGTEAELLDMVQRCRKVGIRIYADVVLNHMVGHGQSGTGSAGTSFNADTFYYPGVPYSREHFHPECPLNNYGDPNNVRNCYLVNLDDLDQHNEYVRNKMAEFLNKYIDLGVAGFRVDASKHMWPQDLAAIQNKLKDLPEGGRPFFAHEVIDQGGEPIKASEYTSLGYVTEFRYCIKLGEGVENFGNFDNAVDYGWGMLNSDHAFVFVDNHDNQRSHGGGGHIITHNSPKQYKMASAFMLANDYGFARIMSSYAFGSDTEQGPPHNGDWSTKDVPINADGSCGDGWVCEHRWGPIANMVAFRNAVVGTNKGNYYNQNNQIAFSRGNKGFFAMARDGHMDKTLQTGLPAGEYCDLITDCAKKITVDGSGMAHIVINNNEEPILAFIVGDQTSGSTGSGSSGTGPVVTSAPVSTVGWSHTVIMMEKQTKPGQDLFIRGGLDHGTHSGCNTNAGTSHCSIPIKARNLGSGAHFAKYNAWSMSDNHLDWYGPEAGQGRYHGTMADGTPAVWTTNVAGQTGYNALNTYGPHYWLVDVDMDCSKTDNGWFEVKGVVNGEWESNIHTVSCSGAGSPPTSTSNHWAKCGQLNVYHFGSNTCEIKSLP